MSQKHVIAPTPRQRAREDAGGHGLLQELLAMDPAATDAWLTAHVVTIEDARKVLAAFAAALRHLHHR
jgi:hypothetical protein